MKPLQLLLVSALGVSVSQAAMTFSVSFTAQALSDLSLAEQALFTGAVAAWDAVIIDHRDGVSRNWNLTVDTISQAASGGSVLLGSASPNALGLSNPVAGSGLGGSWPERFILSTAGSARFNIHPDAGALRSTTIQHEIGHALGIGTLWEDNEVYNDGVSGNSNRTLAGGTAGQYTGAAGLAAYQAEFDAGATFVPVELGGGPGTAHGHWNESDDFGRTATGITDRLGRDLRDELMTGWSNGGTEFLSNTTIQSLYDLGFNVVPEPSHYFLFGFGTLLFGIRRRR